MKITTACCILLGWATLTPEANAQTGTCEAGLAEAFLDVNNVNARILNNGGLYWRGSPHVYEVPKYGNANAIFAAGIWLGGFVDSDMRLAASTYGPWEFWPGPLVSADNPPADCSAYDRIYSVYLRDVDTYNKTGEATQDLLEWPWELGAPVTDGDGNPDNYNLAGGDRPTLRGHQTLWWVMNDSGNTHERTDTQPIGLEVQVTAFAAASDVAYINNTTLYSYKLINRGTVPIIDMYLGFFQDMDLGNFADDYVGSDSLLGLGYAYNADNFDEGGEGYGEAPPAVGIKFLQGALVTNDSLDNDRDGAVDEVNERLGMTGFAFYNGGGGVTGDPFMGMDYYNYLRGLWKDGKPFTQGGTGRDFSTIPTSFIYPGDPVTGEGWSEINPDPFNGTLGPIDPADRRSVSTSGPFELMPGESQEVVLAMIWARGSNNLDSVTQLKATAQVVQEAFDSGFKVEPPVAAPLQAITLRAPANGLNNQPIDPSLFWQPSEMPGTFEVQYATSPNFVDAVSTGKIRDNELRLLDLLPDAVYYWRVRQENAVERGPWSDTWQFKTTDLALGIIGDPILGFMTTQNAAGPINPPDMAAFAFNDSGFPILEGNLTPVGSYPDPQRPTAGIQQVNSDAIWGIHTGGGGRSQYSGSQSFLERSVRSMSVIAGGETLEWHFSQQCLDQINGIVESGDCLAYRLFSDQAFVEVPFALWNRGFEADSIDDFRLIPILCEAACGAGTINNTFDLGTTDHAISSGEDDPYTDWIYWYNPTSTAQGDSGYIDFFFNEGEVGGELLARTVLVKLNAGLESPQDSPLPEPGTVFQIVTKPIAPPVLSAPSPESIQQEVTTRLYWQAIQRVSQVQISTSLAFEVSAIDSMFTGTFAFETEALAPNATYYWRVRSINENNAAGISDWSEPWSFTIPQNVDIEQPDQPLAYTLEAGYPNPFSTQTSIRYALPEPGAVKLEVFDTLGRRVRVLVDNQQTAGWYDAVLDSKSLPSGLYFYRLTTNNFTDTKSVILTR
ncbi:MAG: T9SS type A sorting domain-containing protein [Bacteroidota bacterium]